jgi:hypothetical protein
MGNTSQGTNLNTLEASSLLELVVVYAIEGIPLSCTSFGGTLAWVSWLMCCG